MIIYQLLLTFPEKLNTSIISPIFKKNETTDINNYRPISILPQISKILERIIYNRLIDFITKNNIINQNQFGFIKKHNTTDVILDLYNHILINKTKNKAINTVFIYLSKAFDTIDHIILLEKFKHYGNRGITHELILYYLQNRKQTTIFKSEKSNSKNNNIGVPQGSILGPLLFILYTNDLPDYIHTYTPNNKLTIYADDTAIAFTENNNTLLRNDINKTLLKIEIWFQYNKLKLNITKSEIINFNSSKYPDNIIIFNNNIIKNTDEYKYLGIKIDNKLKFHKHT